MKPQVPARGFTLLEVLVSIALIAALLAALFGFFWNTLNARRSVEDETARQRAATILINSIARDLTTSLVGDDRAGPGIDGSETSLSLLHRGVPVQLARRGSQEPAVLADLQRSIYRFASPGISIERQIVGFDTGDAPAAADLGGLVHRVRFRYHDGSRWRSTFNSLQADALPRAIEVALWFDPWPGEEQPAAAERTASESPGLERLTFDAEAGFDEAAYAEASDLDVFDEPPPDRLRVIYVADSAQEEES